MVKFLISGGWRGDEMGGGVESRTQRFLQLFSGLLSIIQV